MLRRQIRWIIPLVALVVLALAVVIAPAIVTHAASASPNIIVYPH